MTYIDDCCIVAASHPDKPVWSIIHEGQEVLRLTPAMVELLAKAFAASGEVERTRGAYKWVRSIVDRRTERESIREAREVYHVAADNDRLAWEAVHDAAREQARQIIAERKLSDDMADDALVMSGFGEG